MVNGKSKGKRKKNGGSAKEAKLSALQCPDGMDLEQWQRRLRRQAAQINPFGIFPPSGNHSDEPFVVNNSVSGRKYAVHYFGNSSPLNRCECMDFKTNGIGTCKHIEAIGLYANGKYARRHYELPERTFVYVDYTEGRKVKIFCGSACPPALRALADELFDDDGVIRDMACDPSDFISRARAIDASFEWEADALNLIIEARDKRRRADIIARKYADSDLDGLLKCKLHPYQVQGVKFAFAGGRTINADEMGLGKTVQAIATAELLRREGLVESVLIICPTSLKYQWLSEIGRFTDSTALAVEGDVFKRKDALASPDYFYKICSFHAVTNNVKAGFVPEADLVIYDELQRLKNRDTQMGKQLRKLQSQYVMALSGTPLENKLEELYSVTQFADQYLLGPLYKFNAETTLRNETGKVFGYRNLHAVSQKLANILIRRKKADVKLQIPMRTDTNMFVPMTNEQMTIHDECKTIVGKLIIKWRRTKFLSEKDRNRLLLSLSKMRMVCDSTFILDQKSRYDTKIGEIMAIIANLMDSAEGKVVIFSQWERMLRILAHELESEQIDFCFLHGGVPSDKRKGLIDRFRDDADCRVFLSTDAGSTGLNLQAASLLINIDLPWNPAMLEQRIARIYRLGQQNPVQIINMIARDTIEERMLATLDFKSNLAAGILDGGDDAVFLDNNKFNKIAEVVEEVLDDAQTGGDMPVAESGTATAPSDAQTKAASDVAAKTHPDTPASNQEAPTQSDTPQSPGNTQQKTHSNTPQTHGDATTQAHGDATTQAHGDATTQAHGDTPRTHGEMRELVAGGMQLLGTLAEVLRNPKSAQALADVLVEENPDTGKASLNIPVPDKATVVNILSAFSSLLNRK